MSCLWVLLIYVTTGKSKSLLYGEYSNSYCVEIIFTCISLLWCKDSRMSCLLLWITFVDFWWNMLTENVNVNVYVYSLIAPCVQQTSHNVRPCYWNSLLYSLISSRKNSEFAYSYFAVAIANHYNVAVSFYHVPITAGWTDMAWYERLAQHLCPWPMAWLKQQLLKAPSDYTKDLNSTKNIKQFTPKRSGITPKCLISVRLCCILDSHSYALTVTWPVHSLVIRSLDSVCNTLSVLSLAHYVPQTGVTANLGSHCDLRLEKFSSKRGKVFNNALNST